MNSPEPYLRFLDLVKSRYSCRAYLPEPVSREDITAVIETARLAPSACNRQPWKFFVADTPESCKTVALCYDREWAKGVPAFIVACGDREQAWSRSSDGKSHVDIDLSIAIEHICLASAAIGLGTCWICNFDVGRLRNALNMPDNIEPVAIIAIGHYDTSVAIPEKKRKSIDEMIVWED